MDLSYTPEGKLVVRFNGAALTGCFHDTDCSPVNAQCYVNQTRSAFPSMCGCLSVQKGVDCLERSPQGNLRLAFEAIALILALPTLAVGLFDLACVFQLRVRSASRSKRFQWLNVVEATSVFSTLAVVSICLVLCFSILYLSEPRTSTRVQPDGRIIKVSRFGRWPIVSALAFFFGTLACLNLTLLWLSIAHDAMKVRVNKSDLILRYKYFLATYYILFGVLLIVFIQADRQEIALYVAIPAIFVVIATCVYGWYKLRFFRSGFGSESRAVLAKVETTAIFLGASSAATLIFAAIMTQTDRPDSAFTSAANGVFWTVIMLTQISVMSFTHSAIMRRVNKTKSSTVSGKTSSKEYNKNHNLDLDPALDTTDNTKVVVLSGSVGS